jgi:hypothetical protein
MFLGAIASTSFLFSATYETAGPIRPGLLNLSLAASVESVDGQGQINESFASYSATVSGGGTPPCVGCIGAAGLPFTLGTSFTLSFSGSAQSGALLLGGIGGPAYANGSISFSLFEADGTPVAISGGNIQATPEPRSSAMIILLGLIVWRKIRSAASLHS